MLLSAQAPWCKIQLCQHEHLAGQAGHEAGLAGYELVNGHEAGLAGYELINHASAGSLSELVNQQPAKHSLSWSKSCQAGSWSELVNQLKNVQLGVGVNLSSLSIFFVCLKNALDQSCS